VSAFRFGYSVVALLDVDRNELILAH